MRLALVTLAATTACASTAQPPTEAPVADEAAEIHLGDEWFVHRARGLGLSIEQAQARDGAITDDGPPTIAFWDAQLALEAAGLWTMLCNECHGGKRVVGEATAIAAPPHGWGQQSGMIFGRERMHRESFQTIFYGGEPNEDIDKPEMPEWGDKLAREQIWALVYYLEWESSRKRSGLRRR